MNYFLLIVFIVVVIIVKRLLEVNRNKSSNKFNPNNYQLRDTVMTPNERIFFENLKRAIGEKYDIYPQVNLDKIFKVKFLNSRYAFNSAKWSIDRKSIDFLLVTKDTQSPFVGIELDDSSHQREDRIARDEKVGEIFKVNNIPLIRFNSINNLTEEDLKHVFEKHYQ